MRVCVLSLVFIIITWLSIMILICFQRQRISKNLWQGTMLIVFFDGGIENMILNIGLDIWKYRMRVFLYLNYTAIKVFLRV